MVWHRNAEKIILDSVGKLWYKKSLKLNTRRRSSVGEGLRQKAGIGFTLT